MVIISKIGGVDYMAENKLITGEKDMELIKEMNEQRKAVECIVEINKQINGVPTREGMISVIERSKKYASNEIRQIEQQHKESTYTYVTFAEASNEQLFQKMLECRQAIYLHCVNKLGEKIVKNMLKEFKC